MSGSVGVEMRRLRSSSGVVGYLPRCQVGSFECPVMVDRRCKDRTLSDALQKGTESWLMVEEQCVASQIMIMLRGYNFSSVPT